MRASPTRPFGSTYTSTPRCPRCPRGYRRADTVAATAGDADPGGRHYDHRLTDGAAGDLRRRIDTSVRRRAGDDVLLTRIAGHQRASGSITLSLLHVGSVRAADRQHLGWASSMTSRLPIRSATDCGSPAQARAMTNSERRRASPRPCPFDLMRPSGRLRLCAQSMTTSACTRDRAVVRGERGAQRRGVKPQVECPGISVSGNRPLRPRHIATRDARLRRRADA